MTRRLVVQIAVLSLLLCLRVAAAPPQLSPPQKVGGATIRIAFRSTNMEWVPEQLYFVIDGKRVALPPVATGYDRNFSAPRFIARNGRLVGLKFWGFDKQSSRRRVVELSYPDYRFVSRGPWQSAPGGDTVPDPPQ